MQLKTFILYARSDEDLREELERHLQPLLDKGLLSLWPKGKSEPVESWDLAGMSQLSDSDLVLLLWSDAVLRSALFREKALAEKLAHYREKLGLILARECDWQSEVGLSGARVLPEFPGSGIRAVTDDRWNTRDEAWTAVVNGIADLAQTPGKPRSQTSDWHRTIDQMEIDAAKERILKNYQLRGELLEKIHLEDDPVRKMKYEFDIKRIDQHIEQDKQLLAALQ